MTPNLKLEPTLQERAEMWLLDPAPMPRCHAALATLLALPVLALVCLVAAALCVVALPILPALAFFRVLRSGT